jgi:hypothetical protein
MLNGLNDIDSRVAQGILANLALEMMPDPGVETERRTNAVSQYAGLREQLLNELRIRLRLKKNDASPRAMGKLYAALAEEMKRLSLQGEDLNKVKARLGQQGSLSPSEYQVKFSQAFRETAEPCGISESTAESVVRKPDSYEHFKPEHFGFDPNSAMSLFLKVQKETSYSERYIILVFASRKGYVQEVESAWRVYPSDVDLSQARSPKDVLSAFVDVFGAAFTLGEKTGKLFINESLPVKHGEAGKTYFEVFKPVDASVELGFFFGTGKFNKQSQLAEAVISFAIDYTKYAESLNRHGVKVNIAKLKARIANRRATPAGSIHVE